MLFALLDYRDYLSQRGVYSPSYIEQRGGRLLVPENFDDLDVYPPVTLFVMHTRTHFLSWLIMYFQSDGKSQHSIWSHTGIFTYDGNILDVTTEGVVEHPFSDYFDGESYASILEVPFHDESKRHEAVAWGRSQIGTPYGWGTAVYIGLRILLGRDNNYHPRLSADVAVVLALFSLPGLWSRKWLYLTGIAAALYFTLVVLNRPARERDREVHARDAAKTHEEIRKLRSRAQTINDPADHDA